LIKKEEVKKLLLVLLNWSQSILSLSPGLRGGIGDCLDDQVDALLGQLIE
jgi:hypothetical protein